MHLWQALFLGALQGVSELFPVSSLAQTILIPDLLKWDLNQANSDFLAFVVALHLATAVALVIYFWKDWKLVIQGFIGSLKRGKLVYDQPSKFAWLLVAGTIIVGLMGLIFEKKLRLLFDDPRKAWIVAVVLMVNGVIMLLADLLKKQSVRGQPAFATTGVGGSAPLADAGLAQTSPLATERRMAEELTFIEATAIGATQTLALLPGISRSGVTIAAGLLAGLSYEQASRFSFMLATPVIGLAAILKVPRLLAPDARDALGMNIAAAVLAGITAYFSTKFLMKYFQHNRLSPFGWYCIIFGGFALIMLR